VYLVGVMVVMTFVLLSQFLKRKAQDPRLLVAQFQTVIQTVATGPPLTLGPTVIVRSRVQVPD